MSIGGIETQEAVKGVDLEQAILGNAPVNTTTTGGSPGVPASQTPVAPGTPASNAPGSGFVPPNPTNFGWPGVGMGGQGSAYGWPVGDEAMGQRNVASIATPTGPVPVAQQGMPFGAIASRQQAIAERKAAAAKAKQDLYAKFDPQAEIGAPAAPYTVAFNQYVQKDWARFTDDWTKAHGGDRAAAMRYLVENPEGQAYVKQWARDKSALAKENVHYFEKATDLLTKVASGEATAMDKESIDAAMKFVRALDEKGMPLKGVTDIEMRALGRNFEKVISTQQFVKDFTLKAASLVNSQAEMGAVKSLGGGRYGLVIEDKTEFKDFIKEQASALVAASFGTKTQEEAERELTNLIRDESKKRLEHWSPPSSGDGSGGSQKTGPVAVPAYGNVPGSSERGATRKEFPQMRVQKRVSGAGKIFDAVPYDEGRGAGEEVTMHPEGVFRGANGELFIFGKAGADPRARVRREERPNSSGGIDWLFLEVDEKGEEREIDEATYFNNLPNKIVPYNSVNEAVFLNQTGFDRGYVEAEIAKAEAKKPQGPKPGSTAPGPGHKGRTDSKASEPTRTAVDVTSTYDQWMKNAEAYKNSNFSDPNDKESAALFDKDKVLKKKLQADLAALIKEKNVSGFSWEKFANLSDGEKRVVLKNLESL